MRLSPKVVFILAAVAWSCTADRREYVAEVNGTTISPAEFTARYKQYLGDVSGRDNILMRKQILNNMINEKLIGEDVRRQGLDRDSTARRRIEEIRTQAILLGYAQRFALDTVSVTEKELEEEFVRYQTRAAVRYV
jgi:hypothetical protein